MNKDLIEFTYYMIDIVKINQGVICIITLT
jgi:hypothetical protein